MSFVQAKTSIAERVIDTDLVSYILMPLGTNYENHPYPAEYIEAGNGVCVYPLGRADFLYRTTDF